NPTGLRPDRRPHPRDWDAQPYLSALRMLHRRRRPGTNSENSSQLDARRRAASHSSSSGHAQGRIHDRDPRRRHRQSRRGTYSSMKRTINRRSFLAFAAGAVLKADDRPKRDMIVRSTRPEDLEMPLSGFGDYITPIEHFFVRTHVYVPTVNIGDWRLKID